MAMSRSYTFVSYGSIEVTTNDYVLGQAVQVKAFGAWRRGEVTALGPKRITVRYAQNREGTQNERPFSPSEVRPLESGA